MASKWLAVAFVAAFFIILRKVKHVFSRSHGYSLGFHANWQVYACVYAFVFFSSFFQPDVVFPFPLHVCHYICFVFVFLLLVACLHSYCDQCVYVRAHTRFTTSDCSWFHFGIAQLLRFAKVKTKLRFRWVLGEWMCWFLCKTYQRTKSIWMWHGIGVIDKEM